MAAVKGVDKNATAFVAVERTGTTVNLKIVCRSEYEAIELFERLCSSIKSGHVKLELNGFTR